VSHCSYSVAGPGHEQPRPELPFLRSVACVSAWCAHADASPSTTGAPQTVLHLVGLDVVPNALFVSTDGRDEEATSPKALAAEVPLPLPIRPRDMNRALPLDEADDLRHRVLGRNRNQHVRVVGRHVSRLNFTLLLKRQPAEHVPQFSPDLTVDHLSAILRNEHHVVLALPLGVVQRLGFLHEILPQRDALAAHVGSFREGLPELSNSSCLPGRAGGTPDWARRPVEVLPLRILHAIFLVMLVAVG